MRCVVGAIPRRRSRTCLKKSSEITQSLRPLSKLRRCAAPSVSATRAPRASTTCRGLPSFVPHAVLTTYLRLRYRPPHPARAPRDLRTRPVGAAGASSAQRLNQRLNLPLIPILLRRSPPPTPLLRKLPPRLTMSCSMRSRMKPTSPACSTITRPSRGSASRLLKKGPRHCCASGHSRARRRLCRMGKLMLETSRAVCLSQCEGKVRYVAWRDLTDKRALTRAKDSEWIIPRSPPARTLSFAGGIGRSTERSSGAAGSSAAAAIPGARLIAPGEED